MFSPSRGDGSQLDRRQLVRPSANIPWSVDVVSAIPKLLVDKFQLGEVTSSASCPGWACMSLRDGMVYIWQHRTVHNMSDNIEPPKPMKLQDPSAF